MSKQTQETKEWCNVDFSNTAAYKTIKAYNKAGVFAEHKLQHLREYGQLQRLRKIDSLLKQDKGIQRVITTLTRQIIRQQDKQGRTIPKEYLTIGGEFRGFTWTDEEYAVSWEEGWYKKPKIVKIYRGSKKFDPDTGEDLAILAPNGHTIEYTIEVPVDATKRKKLIHQIIDNSQGYPEDIQYYFKDNVSGSRDNTYSYEQFVGSDIEELRHLSKRSAGVKGPGYWRDPRDGKLRDRDGNLVE